MNAVEQREEESAGRWSLVVWLCDDGLSESGRRRLWSGVRFERRRRRVEGVLVWRRSERRSRRRRKRLRGGWGWGEDEGRRGRGWMLRLR